MSRWIALRGEVEQGRARRGDWLTAMTVQVRRAARADICASTDAYRVKHGHRIIGISPRAGEQMTTARGSFPAIRLRNLPRLADAWLSFSIALTKDERAIESYTMTVLGRQRGADRGWYVRLDLDEEQKGEGPCSHALLHAHIGVAPDESSLQEGRVPLPWLAPDDALGWLLATVHGDLEPAHAP